MTVGRFGSWFGYVSGDGGAAPLTLARHIPSATHGKSTKRCQLSRIRKATPSDGFAGAEI